MRWYGFGDIERLLHIRAADINIQVPGIVKQISINKMHPLTDGEVWLGGPDGWSVIIHWTIDVSKLWVFLTNITMHQSQIQLQITITIVCLTINSFNSFKKYTVVLFLDCSLQIQRNISISRKCYLCTFMLLITVSKINLLLIMFLSVMQLNSWLSNGPFPIPWLVKTKLTGWCKRQVVFSLG